jgi:hypothetical protein
MKKRIGLGIALSALALVSTASAALVSGGVPLYIHGNAFHAYNASEATAIDYLTKGVRTLSGSPSRLVIASVTHSLSTGGISYYVNVSHSGSQTTSCTSYTFDSAGNQLSSNSNSFTGSGNSSIFLMLQATGNVANIFNTVLCSIPGSSNGTINSITQNVN